MDKITNWDLRSSGSKRNGWSSLGADAIQTEDILLIEQQDFEQVTQPKNFVPWGPFNTEERKDELELQS